MIRKPESVTIHRLHGWIAATASGPDFIRITCNSEEILCCRITSCLPTIRPRPDCSFPHPRFLARNATMGQAIQYGRNPS
jgi:hypothetical protein